MILQMTLMENLNEHVQAIKKWAEQTERSIGIK